MIQSDTRMARLDPASKNLIVDYLRTHEPAVSAVDNFGRSSEFDYLLWLESYAIVKSTATAGVIEWVTSRMAEAATDPKKIVSVLTSPMGLDVARMAHQTGKAGDMHHTLVREMTGLRQGTPAYSAFEAALDMLKHAKQN